MFLEATIEEAKEPIFIYIPNISTMNGKVVKMNNCDIITLTDESLKKLMAIAKPEKKIKNDEPRRELQELFDKLHKLVGGKGKANFTLVRERKLKDLMTKQRLSEESLIKAATNIGNDDFLQGNDPNNKKRYGDIDYLLRPDKAAKWSEEQTKKKKGMF